MTEEHEPECASDAEVRSEIEALGVTKLRLLRWGEILLGAYGDFAEGRQPQDLYQEAVMRTLARDRKWKPKNCSFAEHLMGVMRSIASHLPEKYGGDARNVPLRGSDLSHPDDEGEEFIDPVQNVAADQLSVEDEVASKRQLDRIERLFEDDEEAFNVLVELAQRKTEPEIAKTLNMPRNVVHAAIQRIRYKIAKAR
jgi:DNA-directed RNA polymerase specialized sigma24 family protein